MFRVRAQNKAGVGKTSEVTDPVNAVTKPGRRTSEELMKIMMMQMNAVTPLFSGFMHHRDRCGCWWWRCHLPELWMLWLERRLQICVVQELRGNHRFNPHDYGDQGKHVRLYLLNWDPDWCSVTSFINPIMCFLCRSKAIFNTPGEEDIGIYSCFVTHTDGVSASYTLSEEGKW